MLAREIRDRREGMISFDHQVYRFGKYSVPVRSIRKFVPSSTLVRFLVFNLLPTTGRTGLSAQGIRSAYFGFGYDDDRKRSEASSYRLAAGSLTDRQLAGQRDEVRNPFRQEALQFPRGANEPLKLGGKVKLSNQLPSSVVGLSIMRIQLIRQTESLFSMMVMVVMMMMM